MTFLEMARVWSRLRLRLPVGLSIDITDRCTLSCAGCYMKWYEQGEDLPLERWEEIVLSLPAFERTFCAWTGGEPLLRADAVRALSRHFAWNWVATNGTLPIPELPRTTVFVSVDGPEELHDSVRGGWRRIVTNVRPEHYIATTLRRENSSPEALRELVEFWRPRARGIVFGFLTPRRPVHDVVPTAPRRPVHDVVPTGPRRPDNFVDSTGLPKGDGSASLARGERERLVPVLSRMRREFGDFVLGVSGQLPDCASTNWGARCPAAETLVALDSRGRTKRPCTLGGHDESEVDCSRCGCAVPAFLRRVGRFHVPTLREVARLFR